MIDKIMTVHYAQLQLDIKSRIFSLLTQAERQLARAVCSDWRNVIEQEFGLKIVANNGTVEVLETASKYARELHLNSLTVPISSLDMTYSPKLTVLKFSNIVVTYNLIPLLRKYSNSLTTLGFNQIIVDLPQQLQMLCSDENKIRLSKLETLEINEWNLSDSLAALLEMLNGGVTFGKLVAINIILQNPPSIPLQLLFQDDSNPFSSTVPSYVQIFKNNLQSLEIIKYGRPIANTILKFYPHGSIPNAPHPTQIRELLVYSQFKMEWLPMLLTQTHLQRIHIGDCRVGMWEAIKNAVQENASTLETFWIAGQSYNQPWEFNSFANCKNLKQLCVQLYMSPKVNLGVLPLGLTHINMSGSIKKEEILSLLQRLPACEEAEFSHLGINQGDSFDDHVSCDIFLRFVQLPKLSRLSFLHCDWNEGDWDEVIKWCSSNVSQGIYFEQLYYPLHGQEIRHGIHVKVEPHFDRSSVIVTTPPDGELSLASASDGACHAVYSLLTSWL